MQCAAWLATAGPQTPRMPCGTSVCRPAAKQADLLHLFAVERAAAAAAGRPQQPCGCGSTAGRNCCASLGRPATSTPREACKAAKNTQIKQLHSQCRLMAGPTDMQAGWAASVDQLRHNHAPSARQLSMCRTAAGSSTHRFFLLLPARTFCSVLRSLVTLRFLQVEAGQLAAGLRCG